MGRPPLPLGTWGKIRIRKLPSGVHRAIAKYRDYDGVTRRVERVGATNSKAQNNLLEALRDRVRVVRESEITANSKVEVGAAVYFAELKRSDKAVRTKQDYMGAWERYLREPLAQLR
ncbi:hypothetical protein SAMN05421630_110237 [Prauserella marina]|uniref:Uncharacterized protein n=1 Tax=Prauserella marina TaxID=530584 RepID=A0A1G6W890_9PSEU|nr:hypothetical protein [Prauserella marina]PWV74062.1 hypothetical protein DES30_108236 [Prauserella marina]SDD62041.1 hypothetical protein SAMN05421630_110237 [Prauserella marina]